MATEKQASQPLANASASVARISDPADRVAVECAAGLFLKRGISGVRMTDIAEASGIGVATLYRHFSTKTDLAIEAATLLWGRFHASFRELVARDDFAVLDGLGRLRAMLEEYGKAYQEFPEFVAFLDEFDRLVLDERVAASRLAAYGDEVNAFYPVFEESYHLGVDDGSIVGEVDFPIFYQAIAHSLIGVAEKLVRGEVIPSDDFSRGDEELECIVDMAIRSLGEARS